MKLKTFILTFLMMSCSIVFGQGTTTGNASNENWLKAQLEDSDYGTIILAKDIELTTGNIVIPKGRTVTIDLNGHTLSTTDNSTYIINNLGKLTIKDSNESGKGKISAYGGIYNGKTYNPNVRTAFGDVNLSAKLTIESGVIEDISSDKRAVIYNYGMLYITGGKFYGKYSGITNYGMADIKNTYIECLGADNDVAAIVNDFDITFGENVYIAGEYRAVTGTAAYTGTPIFLYAELNGKKYSSLQDAIDNAIDGDVVTLIANGTEDEVLITQKADVDVTINGNNKTFTGHITIFGSGRHTGAETLTIKNVVFQAVDGKGECIASATKINGVNSYAHNVTVEGCTFKGNDTYSADNTFAIRFPSGGVGYDLTVTNCIADEKMFGLLWVTQVGGELIVDNCTAEGVKEGIVLTNTTNATITKTTIDASTVAIRAGQTGAADGTINEFKFNNNTLKSNDIAIQIRGNATDANLSMEKNVVSGTTHISGNTAATKIAADANYWDGEEAPVATTPIVVNSYYLDEALTTLKRIPMGSDFTAYTREDAIWGEVGGNAIESFVIKVLDADGNVMGTTSLNNVNNIIDGSVYVTWSLKLNAESNQDEYWTMQWTTAPSIDNMPAKVELYVDGTRVSGGDVVLNAPDNLSKINAANIDADGKILSYRTTLEEAVNNGDNVAILTAGTYDVPTGKNLTITGAVDGVVFDMPQRYEGNIPVNASMTFNNVTFQYYNYLYVGLSYSNIMVYNNCVINGQVFLYGNKETFNNCTFNQNSSDAYNVWTYGAKEVAFNECTFNSAGKSVLIYKETTPGFVANVSVDKCEFNATTAVEDKAAIEMDSSLIGGINLTIDSEDTPEEDRTTATGFNEGNASGNSLWNNKKGNNDDANNNITVVVAGETVLEPVYEAQIEDKKFRNLTDAFAAVNDNTTLIIFEGEYDNALSINKSNVTVTGDGEVKLNGVPSLKGTNYKVENIDFVYSTGMTNLSGSGLIKDCSFTATADDGDNFRYCYGTEGAKITFENCVLDAPMWAIHFDSAPGLDLVLTDCEINGRVALGANLGSLMATRTTFKNGYVNVWGTEDGATFTESIFVDVPYIFTGYDADNIVEFNDCEVTVGNDTSDVVSIIYGGIGNADALIYVDDVLMTGVAAVNNIHYATFEEALEAIDDNVTLKLLKDIVIEEPITITKNGVTLDGNDKTLTYTGTDRAIDVPNDANANIDVTVKKLTVVATTANRGLNYNENGKFNVEGVTVTIGENVDGYAINFPGMADNAQVTIKNSNLTSRNPLNIWGENMDINVYDSEIISVDNSTTYDYAAIQLNNDNYGNVANGTVVNVYGGVLTATDEKGEPSNVVANATETGVVNISDETVVTGKVLDYVANIGGAYFGSLQAAVNAIEKQGYNSPIVIMKSFATSETATVKNGLNVTIDLNGKTITVTDKTEKNFEVIKNQGTLTIKDSSAEGTGKITVEAIVNSGWNRYSAVIANTVGGKLIVESGTLEHLGGTDMAYGIDNLTNGKGTYAETVINGGTIKSTYRGIRQFLNGTEALNILTVNGGTIEGANKSIWMQDPNKNANTGTLTVGENATLKGNVYLTATAGSTEWPVEVSIAAGALAEGSEVLTSNLPLGIDVQNINGTYGVVNVVAQIDGTYYQTFEAALNAVQDGETITVLDVEGSENKELEFTKDIEFTITGTAPDYALPVVTFQNATVNISNAEILIPELDARQNATINVINSTVYDAGGNSIAKSYYDGAINISGTSEVYMMQVTTMGYINISGTAKLHATWQTNVYGNGLITLNNGATFATAGLNLIAKDYEGRDNTDADRVGKPAEIVVNGANFTVGKVYSASGADYSYNADGYGINVGTIEGKSAILTIENGGKVNIYTGDGKTANIGAYGTVNIDASTFNVECRAENGTATLANNGTVNVTDESTLNIQTLTGESIKFLDGAIINNSTVGGNVFVAGAVTFRGDNTFAMLYDFGTLTNNYGTTAPMKWNVEKGASVTLTEKARYGLGYGDEVTVIGNIENALTARENLSDDDRSLFMHGLVAQESSGWNCNSKLTVKNAYVVLGSNNSFGNKPGNYGGTYKFDFNNSVVDGSRITFYGANSQTEFTLTNSDVRIGTFMTRDADSKFILTGSKVLSTAETNGNDEGNYNAGELVLNNSSLTYNAAFTNTGVLNIGENSNVKATTVINNGTINFTSLTSILETATEGLVITLDSNYPDHKVVYKDGKYQVVEKDYVAQIGEQGYETLAEAATAAQDGETIQLLWEEGDAAISMAATFVGNKTVTIKGTANVDWSKGFFFVGRNGEGDGKVIFDNANLTSVSNSSAHGFNVSGGKLNDNTTNNGIVEIKNSTIVLDYMLNKNVITLDNSTLTVKNGFSVTGREASESATGEDATATMTLSNNSKVVVNNMNGMGIGHEAYGIMNIDATSTFETTQYFNISAKGTMNVNGGNVKVAGTLDNNGTMVVAAESNVEVTGNLNVNGTLNSAGNIDANIVKAETATIQLTGGIYTTEPQDGWCAESYGAFPYDENSWVVREISGEQTFELIAGWNWVSSYITEFNEKDGLEMLQNGLGTYGIQIKNDDYTSTYRNNNWSGRLESVSVEEMYKVNMNGDVNFKFEGGFVNYDECKIVLYPGWNYIGYPVNVETNLADALVILSADGQEESNGAKEGDVIKSQQGSATYIGSSTWLFTNSFNLVPGEGYMYYNTSDEVKFLRYTTKEATTTSETNTRSNNHWTVDATQYPSNMTMIAMTDVEGGNYEVAAFVNGEVRGSSRPVYVESLDAYILILTISGDDVEEMTFKCYDLSTNTEYDLNNKINYSNDAIVGSIYEPYMLTRGTTGIGEAAMSNVNIYPNPTTTGTEINLQATCDKVEVFNALGVKVAEYRNVDSIDALETAGIYVIRITNNGNVQNCRLVVK